MASCISCKKDAKYYCGKCMRIKYCGSSCQSKHFKHHNKLGACVPFYFIAGQTTKRTADQEEEDEEKAESAYVKLFAAYRRNRDDTLIPQLEEWYGRMSEEARRRYRDNLPCHDDTDPLSQDSIASLEPDNRFYLMANNVKYCFNLDLLVGYVNSREARDPIYGRREAVNPITRQPFSEEDLNRLRDAKSTRLPTLWEKVRETQDVVVLEETLDTLLNMYRIEVHFVDDAKKIRLEKELKKNPVRNISSLIRSWSLWKVLGVTFDTIKWKEIDGSFDYIGFEKLFENANDFKEKFWKFGSFRQFLKENDLVITYVQKHFFPNYERGSGFQVLLTLLSSYKLSVYGAPDYVVVPRDDETIKDAYHRVWKGVKIPIIPYDRKIMNESWIEVVAGWEGSAEDENEHIFEDALPWPTAKPVFNSKGVATLKVTFHYEEPFINIMYEFGGYLKEKKRTDISFYGTDLMLPFDDFKRKFTKWPITEKDINYKYWIDVVLNPKNTDIVRLDDITQDPYEHIYKTLRKYIHDERLAGPETPNARWKIVVHVEVDLYNVYEKGIQYLAANWSHYKNVMKLDYKDFDWDKIPYDPKEGKYWAKLFDGVEDMARAYMTTKFFNFHGRWRMGLQNARFWTAILGTSEFNQTIFDTFYQQLSKAQHNYQQKEWAKTATYKMKLSERYYTIENGSYEAYAKKFKDIIDEISQQRRGIGKRWTFIQTFWKGYRVDISLPSESLDLPWPNKAPPFTKEGEERVLIIDFTNRTPGLSITPVYPHFGGGFDNNYWVMQDTRFNLPDLENYYKNEGLQKRIREYAQSWWDGSFKWINWPEDQDPNNYHLIIRLSKLTGYDRDEGPLLGEFYMDDIKKSPYVAIVERFATYLEKGLLDDAVEVYARIEIKEK